VFNCLAGLALANPRWQPSISLAIIFTTLPLALQLQLKVSAKLANYGFMNERSTTPFAID
jgi:hypothetical protein